MKKKTDHSIGSSGDKLPVNTPPVEKQERKRGERYISEAGNIEDLPTPAQIADAEKTMKKGKSTK